MSRPRHLYPQELTKLADAKQPAPAPRAPAIPPSVTIVVLTLDRLHLTRRCIESIYAHSEYPFTLLIHDDGSQPDTLNYLNELAATHDNVQLTAPTHRIGCAAARNRAFAQVNTDYIFSLDNDMVCQPHWLRETMACALRHNADFVAPLRLDVNGRVWAFAPELVRTENDTVLEIARWFHDLPLDMVQSLFSTADAPTNFISGGAGLYSRAAFQRCGSFTEYEIGFEDMDFSLKLAAQGYTLWATAGAVLTHDDAWLPQTPADVEYARSRYHADTLRRAADQFHARWGFEVLPTKYVESLEQRLEQKLQNVS
ncbi:MAG TPA: glycosyltransferase [Anaerolineae bacterium]|nr:glycosyltransferase [Anaerolineae bacterium]